MHTEFSCLHGVKSQPAGEGAGGSAGARPAAPVERMGTEGLPGSPSKQSWLRVQESDNGGTLKGKPDVPDVPQAGHGEEPEG